MKSINVPDRCLSEIVNLLSNEYQKVLGKQIETERHLSDAKYALDAMSRKYDAACKAEDALRRQVDELASQVNELKGDI